MALEIVEIGVKLSMFVQDLVNKKEGKRLGLQVQRDLR